MEGLAMWSGMMRRLCLIVLLGFLAFGPCVAAQDIVTLQTRPNVTQSYFLACLPKERQAIAVLFPGGNGSTRLRKEDGQMKFSPSNFVVRACGGFVMHGAIAGIEDSP